MTKPGPCSRKRWPAIRTTSGRGVFPRPRLPAAGVDWEAAERALRAVLALKPDMPRPGTTWPSWSNAGGAPQRCHPAPNSISANRQWRSYS
jgi:hypothetical protein